MSVTARETPMRWDELAAPGQRHAGGADPVLAEDLLEHLETQLASARRMRQIVHAQASAIRRRAVREVVAAAGELQVEMHRRELIERERLALTDRAGAHLGRPGAGLGLRAFDPLLDPATADVVHLQVDELAQLLVEVDREHTLNRALMAQELAFLDHLLSLADGSGSYAAAAPSRGSGTADGVRRIRPATQRRRVFDLEA